MITNIDEIYSGSENWLKANDLEGRPEWHLRIEAISETTFKNFKGEDQRQIVLQFFGAKKKLGLNKTNARRMANMFGKNPNNWISQEVTLYVTETENHKGETVLGIRVREYPAGQPLQPIQQPKGFVSGLPQQHAATAGGHGPQSAISQGALTGAPRYDERNPPPHDRMPVGAEMNDEIPF